MTRSSSPPPLAVAVVCRLFVLALLLAASASCGSSAREVSAPAGRVDDTPQPSTEVTSGADNSTDAEVPPPLEPNQRPFDVANLTFEFVDDSRITPAGTDRPERSKRDLPTLVYLPESSQPVPLIVLAHGAAGDPDGFAELSREWAKAGYAVALPRFPLSNNLAGPPFIDAPPSQAADISFVLDALLAEADTSDSPMEGAIDPERLGIAGLSLGAMSTYFELFQECCRDDRFDAAALFAGQYGTGGDTEVGVGSQPVLLIHGDADAVLPYGSSVDFFERIEGEKYLLTLLGGTHSAPFNDVESPHDEAVEELTTTFWDLTLGGERSARERLIELDLRDLVAIRAGTVTNEGQRQGD